MSTADQLARITAAVLEYEPSPEVRERAAVVGHIAVVHDFEGLMCGYADWHAEAEIDLENAARDGNYSSEPAGQRADETRHTTARCPLTPRQPETLLEERYK